MNAFALLAYNKPYVDYTRYCDSVYKYHLGGFISTIELKIGTFDDLESLADSELVYRIERIFPKSNHKSYPELICLPDMIKTKDAIAMLQSLYRIDDSVAKGIGYNVFPEVAQCAEKPQHVTIIAYIALGKLSHLLGHQWAFLNVSEAYSRLYEYISIYRYRTSKNWWPGLHFSLALPEPTKAILWPNFIWGAGGANERSKKIWLEITKGFDMPTASSTAAQRIQATPSTSNAGWEHEVSATFGTSQSSSITCDIDADDLFDAKPKDE